MTGPQNVFSQAPLAPVAYKTLKLLTEPAVTLRTAFLSCTWSFGTTRAKIHPSTAPSVYLTAVILVILFAYS